MSGVPAQNTTAQDYRDHMVYDSVAATVAGPGLRPATSPSMEFVENLLGQRTGVGITTPWSTPIRTGMRAAPYTDTNVGGTVTSTAGPPATLTDTAKAWVVNQWGPAATGGSKTVFSLTAGGLITKFKIASNTATVLSAAATVGWSNGTPAANALYWIQIDNYPQTGTGQAVAQGAVLGADNWWAELRQAPGNPGGG
jgi:hypothetical protein